MRILLALLGMDIHKIVQYKDGLLNKKMSNPPLNFNLDNPYILLLAIVDLLRKANTPGADEWLVVTAGIVNQRCVVKKKKKNLYPEMKLGKLDATCLVDNSLPLSSISRF